MIPYFNLRHIKQKSQKSTRPQESLLFEEKNPDASLSETVKKYSVPFLDELENQLGPINLLPKLNTMRRISIDGRPGLAFLVDEEIKFESWYLMYGRRQWTGYKLGHSDRKWTLRDTILKEIGTSVAEDVGGGITTYVHEIMFETPKGAEKLIRDKEGWIITEPTRSRPDSFPLAIEVKPQWYAKQLHRELSRQQGEK